MAKIVKRIILSIAYRLDGSKRYRAFKTFFYNLLENNQYHYKKYFDGAMIFFVVSSIVILIRDVKEDLPEWMLFYDSYIVTIVFLTEYLLRMWIHNDMHAMIIEEHEHARFLDKPFSVKETLWRLFKKKWEYVSSLSAIIDLLAIIPSYRPLRILRIFLLFRAFKLLRYAKSVQDFVGVFASKKQEFYSLLIFSSFIIFVSAILIYIFEGGGENEKIGSLFDAIYWSVITMTTVGYGDIAPVTTQGRSVAMVVIFAGVGMMAFATSVAVSALNEKLDDVISAGTKRKVGRLKEYYIMAGFSPMAQMLAEQLREHGRKVVVIDTSEQRVELARKSGLLALNVDATLAESYSEILHSEHLSAVLCLNRDDIKNLYIILTLQSFNKSIPIYARANHRQNIKKFEAAGASHVFYAYEIIGLLAKEYIGQSVAFDAMYAILADKDRIKLDEYIVEEGNFIENKKLKEIDFFMHRLILIGINSQCESEKKCFVFNPSNEYTIIANDTLILMGEERSLEHFRRKIELNGALK